ncbi:trigger factor, partial [bacterium]|nr:trigger factor [bacterium]
MKVTTETVATREVKLTIEPDQETVRESLRRTARRVSRHRPVPGYRPGHAPYGLVENIYGHETLLYQTLDDLGPRLYREAIEEADIEPFSQGQLDVESEDPLVLTARVPLVPLVELGDYKELSIEPAQEVSVSEEQIQERLVQLQQENLEYASVERGAQMGDQVVASIVGTADGEIVVDQGDTNLDLDDDLTPPGFAEALLGVEANELREFSLSFPEDHDNEELAGRQIDFEVVVKSVREVIIPEIDDDLAKTVGDYENLAELKEAVGQVLEQELRQEAEQNELDAALEALIEISKIEYPKAMIEQEIEAALDNQRQRLQQMGFTFESYLRMSGETEEDW